LPISACVTQKAGKSKSSSNTNSQPTTQLFFSAAQPPEFFPLLANLPRFCCPMRQKWQFLIKLFSFFGPASGAKKTE